MPERNGHLQFPDDDPPLGISRPQRLHLDLMRLASFHHFDGDRVATDLETNRSLWRAAMMGNFEHGGELLALRDMARGFYNADTLMVLTDEKNAPPMEELAWRWQAQEVGWLEDEDAAEALGLSPVGTLRILRCWWD